MLSRGLGIFLIGVCLAAAVGASERSIGATTQSGLDKRVALVIGNDRYKTLPSLNNAGKDARDIAAKLKSLGFEVLLETNAGAKEIARALAKFEGSLSDAEAGLVFYAGHGIQTEGKNYLIPSDAEIEFEEDLRFEGIEATEFMESMARAGASVNLMILDACRNNPLKRRTRSAARGLVAVPVPRSVKGAAILYSAGPGETAQDGPPGRNGVFTGALLKALNIPGRTVEQVFRDTARRVREATGGRQTPWNNSSLIGEFYFVPPSSTADFGSSGGVLSMDLVFWQSIQNSANGGDYCAYLESYPSGLFATLAKRRAEQYSGSCLDTSPTAPSPSASTPEPMAPQRDLIREVQRLLSDLGYNVGGADGIAGARTESAVRTFRTATGLPATGKIDEALASTLRRTIAERRTASPPPPSVSDTPNQLQVEKRSLKPGDVFRDCEGARLVSAGSSMPGMFCGPEMVVVPAGSFDMGDLNGGGFPEEQPIHRVTVSRPFAVGVYEITQAEYQALMGSNPSRFKADRNPVEMVSWNDAKEFVKRLKAKTGKGYRLLSEAEWEYAARAGKRKKYPWGNDIGRGKANCNSDCGDSFSFTAPVGRFQANAFGLFDTAGNVWEWVEDCWNGSYNGAPSDGQPWIAGDCRIRVLRGGSWYLAPRYVRSANRHRYASSYRGNFNGFRVARAL